MDTPDILPPFGRSGTLNFAWITPPASPIIFSYTVSVPTNPAGIQQLNAKIRYRRLAGEVPTPVQPNPLVFESCEADFDKDGDIDGYDLLEATKAGNEVNLSDFAQKYGRLNCD
jgi:hypothetical protein